MGPSNFARTSPDPFGTAPAMDPQPNPFSAPAPNGAPWTSSFVAPATEAPATVPTMAAPRDVMLFDDATHDDAAPSRQDLLQRAAELGPPRLTLENIMLSPTDPILGEKMQPRVAERRARFRKIVKVAVGACVAFCVVAIGATALSTSPAHASSSSHSATKTVPATGVVPVEKLEIVSRTKAPSHHVTAAARPASVGKKRR